jgi:drug/metabolite transporter (DMT)-like permease
MNDIGLDAMLLVLIAFSSAGIMLMPALIIQRKAWLSKFHFVLLVAFFGGMANASFQTAIYHGDVIRVMILFYLLPVWSVIGGKIFFKEKIDTIRATAVIAALSGAALILGINESFFQQFSYIDVLAICSGLGLAFNNLVFRATPDIPVASKISAMFLGCAAMIGVSILIGATAITYPENMSVTGYAIVYGVLWITLITFGTQWSVTHLEAGRSSLIIVSELVVAVVSAAIITQADMTTVEIAGGLLVLSAAIIEGTRAAKPDEYILVKQS